MEGRWWKGRWVKLTNEESCCVDERRVEEEEEEVYLSVMCAAGIRGDAAGMACCWNQPLTRLSTSLKPDASFDHTLLPAGEEIVVSVENKRETS